MAEHSDKPDNESLPPPESEGSRSRAVAPYDERAGIMPYTGMPGGAPEDPDEEEINLRDYWQVLVRRKWTVMTFFTLVVAATLIATFLATPIYRATTTVKIDREPPKVVNYEDVMPVQNSRDKDFYETQYQMLKSRTLAQRVIDQLGLASRTAFVGKDEGSLLGGVISTAKAFVNGGEEEELSEEEKAKPLDEVFRQDLTVSPVGDSRLVKVHYDSPDPELAARVANTLVENFIETNLERRVEATSYAKNFLKDRLKQVKAKLEDSERRLANLARQEEIINVDVKQTVAQQKLKEINEALTEAEQARIEAEARYEEMKNAQGDGLPEVLESPVIQKLKETRASLQAEYQDKLSVYKPAYPRMKQLKGQIEEIESQIDTEVQSIRQAIRSDYEAAKQREAKLEAKLAELKDKALDLEDKGVDYRIAKREVDTNRQLYQGLLQRMKEVSVAGGVGTNNISIVDPAQVPHRVHSPSLKKNMLLAIVLGLFGGIGLAFLFEHLDDSVKGAEDLERSLGMAVLGSVPEVKGRNQRQLGLASHEDPTSALAEAYRSLRTALMFSTGSGAPKTLLMTSAGPGEGKTTSAVNVATAFAQTGGKVLLIDADLRNPALHKEFKLDNSVGLTNYLTGEVKPANVAQHTDVPRLFVVSSGPLPPNPAELLSGGRMVDLLSLGAEKFDYVVLDGPPVLGLADALVLGNMVEGTAVVVEAGATRQKALENAIKRLRSARAPVLGAVLAKVGQGSSGYGYDQDYYASYYYYRRDDGTEPEKLTG